MKVQNFKRALLLCVVAGAGNLSWGATTADIFDAYCGGTPPTSTQTYNSPYGVIYNSNALINAWGAGGVLTNGTATTTKPLVVEGENPVLFDTTSTLGTATANFALDITKDTPVTIAGAVVIRAPIKSSGGGTLYFTGTAPTATGCVNNVIPAGYTSWNSYYAAHPLYKASTTSVATATAAHTLPTILDVATSLTLDLTGTTATAGNYAFPLDFALQAGQTLTILTSTTSANSAQNYIFSGALRGSGNIIVKGYGVVQFTGSAADFTGDISISSTNATDYPPSPAAMPAMTLYKPALNFTSGVYASDLSIPANTYQVVNLAGNSAISGAISGAGNLLVNSGTTAQYTLRLTSDNSDWTGGLVLGDGATGNTASAYGPKIQVENANALGSPTVTGGITLNFGATQVSAPVIAFKANSTTARPISVAGTNTTTHALAIHTFDGFITNFNGIISGTSGHGDALRLTGEGTTNLNAANTHAPSSSSSYATYVTGGGTVGMGTATSLGYNATANLTGVFFDDGVEVVPPNSSVTIANPATLYQGTTVVRAPATAGNVAIFSGVWSGTGGIERGVGLGQWTFTGANTYTGGFRVPAGLTGVSAAAPVVVNIGVTAVAGTSSALGNGPITIEGLGTKLVFAGAYSLNNKAIAANGALAFDTGTYDAVVPADISGTTAPSKVGSTGKLTLTPSTGNSFTGTFVNGGGTVAAGSDKTVMGSTNNIILKGNTVASGLKSAYLPYGATLSQKNPGTTDMTIQVQGS